MRAILIDPVEKSIEEKQIQGWEDVKTLIGCDILSDFTITQGEVEGLHVRVAMFLDDDGLMRADNAVTFWPGLGISQPLAGRLVIAVYHVDEEGDMHFVDVMAPIDHIRKMMTFTSKVSDNYQINTEVHETKDGALIQQTVEEKPDEVPAN